MTGFALQTSELPTGTLSVELRAVNSRFLDLILRVGEDFRVLEPSIRERVGEAVKRGKIECRVNFNAATESRLPESLNATLLAQLRALAAQARQAAPDAAPLSTAELLRWPGMLGDSAPDPASLHGAARALLDAALTEFNAARGREGAKLGAFILERVAGMRRLVEVIRPRVPEIVAAYRDKLTRRMEELLSSPDHERIHQEVALLAQKIDVDEELDRLGAHLGEIERVIKAGGAVGKRLDFLMQELNREANTLGSKSVSLESTQTSVELKVLIEQMREQIQNLE